MKTRETLKLIVSIAVPLSAGFLGSLATRPAIDTWYQNLLKPAYQPPAWIFSPVWTTLYILMGIAAYLVWRQTLARRAVRVALLIFIIQLILNAAWSFMFFGLRSPLLGLINIVLLWFAIFLTIVAFARVSKVAAILLIPYILWVSFAMILNFSIWRLNPGAGP